MNIYHKCKFNIYIYALCIYILYKLVNAQFWVPEYIAAEPNGPISLEICSLKIAGSECGGSGKDIKHTHIIPQFLKYFIPWALT